MKNTLAVALALLVLGALCIAFQWRETSYNDRGQIVLLRTNRYTGTSQVFHPETGWTTPGGGRNVALDQAVDQILADKSIH